MQSHTCPSCNDNSNGKDEADILLSEEIDDLSVLLGSIELRSLKAYRIQGIQRALGDEQSGKHGKHDTNRQSTCKALNGT